jgi:hypothetical protein
MKDETDIPQVELMRAFMTHFYDRGWRINNSHKTHSQDDHGAVYAGDILWHRISHQLNALRRSLQVLPSASLLSQTLDHLPLAVQFFHCTISSADQLHWNFSCQNGWNSAHFEDLNQRILTAFQEEKINRSFVHLWCRWAYSCAWAIALSRRAVPVENSIPEIALENGMSLLQKVIASYIRTGTAVGSEARTHFRRLLLIFCLPATGFEEYSHILSLRPAIENAEDMFKESMIITGMSLEDRVKIVDMAHAASREKEFLDLLDVKNQYGVRQQALLFVFSRLLLSTSQIDFWKEYFFFPHQMCSSAFLKMARKRRASDVLNVGTEPLMGTIGGHVFIFFRGEVLDCGMSFEKAIITWLYLMHESCKRTTLTGKSLNAFFDLFFKQ